MPKAKPVDKKIEKYFGPQMKSEEEGSSPSRLKFFIVSKIDSKTTKKKVITTNINRALDDIDGLNFIGFNKFRGEETTIPNFREKKDTKNV